MEKVMEAVGKAGAYTVRASAIFYFEVLGQGQGGLVFFKVLG